MDRKTARKLLDKYLNGTCTPEEGRKVMVWLRQTGREDHEWLDMEQEEQQRYLSNLYGDIRGSIEQQNALTVQERNPVQQEGDLAQKKKGKAATRMILWRPAGIAAAFLLLAGFFIWFFTGRTPVFPGNTPTFYTTEHTGTGKVKKLQLSDGSIIWLNARSSLKYPGKFEGDTREVFLNGEAFFQIAPDSSMPFIIHTGNMQTRVIGTKFNVQAYEEDRLARVAVVSGKVEVSLSAETGAEAGPGEKVFLEPGQLVTYQKAGEQLKQKSIKNAKDYAAWKEGRLVFDHTPMPEVCARLERALGLKLNMENQAISGCKITGRFKRDQPAALTVKAICLSIDAQYEIRDSIVTIRGPGCLK